MSIAQRNEIEALKQRVSQLESLVDTLSNVVQGLQNRELTQLQSKTLTLPEKRKSA